MKGINAVMVGLLTGGALAGCSSTPELPKSTPVAASQMQCAQAKIGLGPSEDGQSLELTYLGETLDLKRAPSSSGVRYNSVDDPDTWFRNKANEATFHFQGQTFPTCIAVGGVQKPFVARGNEPFWKVIVEHGQLILERPDHETESLRYTEVSASPAGRHYRATKDGLSVSLVTAPQLCRDSMTGMPYPAQVRLSINGEVASGCGGNPQRLLTGTEWGIEYIGGRGIIDKSRVTLRFMEKNRLSGSGGCNSYTGQWELLGDGIKVGPLASTRKACAPALMDQESGFFRELEKVERFDISPAGALLLITADGTRLKAFQSTQ